MLVICAKTGMTYERKVWKEGEILFLTGRLEGEYSNLSDEKWLRKQNKIYGFVLFRRPTDDEIIKAIKDKKLDPGSAAIRKQLSKKQLRIAYDYAESKEAKKLKAIQMLREGLDEEVEDAPEEKVVKAPEKKVEAPKEKAEPIELPEEPEESVKEPAEKAPEEEPKAEESVKEPEASEEAPEKESKPEEPVKEASEKKEKKKK